MGGVSLAETQFNHLCRGSDDSGVSGNWTSCNTFYKGDVVKCTVCNAGPEGGEIGEVGKENSNEQELRAYLDNFND